MTQLLSSPNFPLNLDIHPSAGPGVLRGDLDNFGSAAQMIAIQKYGIAGRVWEAAYAMVSYIRSPSTMECDPPFFRTNGHHTIIELGSGNGLVASIVSELLKRGRDILIATDLPEVCPMLENNLRPTSSSLPSDRNEVTVKPLSWGSWEDAGSIAPILSNEENSSRYLTHIICSDLVYFPELFSPLLRTLLHLTLPPFASERSKMDAAFGPSIFISYKVRSLTKESTFWAAFGLWFEFRPALIRENSGKDTPQAQWRRFGSDCDDTTFVFVAHRRVESYYWRIPLSDEDLLAGVGAKGTDLQKSDDAFESLLVMLLGQE